MAAFRRRIIKRRFRGLFLNNPLRNSLKGGRLPCAPPVDERNRLQAAAMGDLAPRAYGLGRTGREEATMAGRGRIGIALAASLLALALPALAQVPAAPAPAEDLSAVMERQHRELNRLTRQVEAMAAARTAALRASPAFQESFAWYRIDGGRMSEVAFAVAYLSSDSFGQGRFDPDDVARCQAQPHRGGPEQAPCTIRTLPEADMPGTALGYYLRDAALRAKLDEVAQLPHMRAYIREHQEQGRGGSPRYIVLLYAKAQRRVDPLDPAMRLLSPILYRVPLTTHH